MNDVTADMQATDAVDDDDDDDSADATTTTRPRLRTTTTTRTRRTTTTTTFVTSPCSTGQCVNTAQTMTRRSGRRTTAATTSLGTDLQLANTATTSNDRSTSPANDVNTTSDDVIGNDGPGLGPLSFLIMFFQDHIGDAACRNVLHCDVTSLALSALRSIVMSMSVCLTVSLCVCLSVRVRSHNSKTARPNFTNFLCMLPVSVARSSSKTIAIFAKFSLCGRYFHRRLLN